MAETPLGDPQKGRQMYHQGRIPLSEDGVLTSLGYDTEKQRQEHMNTIVANAPPEEMAQAYVWLEFGLLGCIVAISVGTRTTAWAGIISGIVSVVVLVLLWRNKEIAAVLTYILSGAWACVIGFLGLGLGVVWGLLFGAAAFAFAFFVHRKSLQR